MLLGRETISKHLTENVRCHYCESRGSGKLPRTTWLSIETVGDLEKSKVLEIS